MSETIEKAYSPKEMSITLDIGDSTLRKWCLALENNGYGFIRNEQNNRVFVEDDLVILRHFQNLIKTHNLQLENAAKLIIDRFGKGSFEVRTAPVPAEKELERRSLDRYNDGLIPTLLEHINIQENYMNRQEKFNQELLKRLDQQQNYIEERLNERDKNLLESLRASQEIKRQLIEISSIREEKKGFFARLFGR